MSKNFIVSFALEVEFWIAISPSCCNKTESLKEKLDEIILLNENGNNDLLLYSRLLSFINLVLYDSEIPNLQSGKNYEIISNAKRFIENNYKNSINLKDIADSVNLSPIYFHNIFTNACGVSPHDYLIDCRITEAKKQLWDSDKNLDFIAQNCGFGCAQYFSRIFNEKQNFAEFIYDEKNGRGAFRNIS